MTSLNFAGIKDAIKNAKQRNGEATPASDNDVQAKFSNKLKENQPIPENLAKEVNEFPPSNSAPNGVTDVALTDLLLSNLIASANTDNATDANDFAAQAEGNPNMPAINSNPALQKRDTQDANGLQGAINDLQNPMLHQLNPNSKPTGVKPYDAANMLLKETDEDAGELKSNIEALIAADAFDNYLDTANDNPLSQYLADDKNKLELGRYLLDNNITNIDQLLNDIPQLSQLIDSTKDTENVQSAIDFVNSVSSSQKKQEAQQEIENQNKETNSSNSKPHTSNTSDDKEDSKTKTDKHENQSETDEQADKKTDTSKESKTNDELTKDNDIKEVLTNLILGMKQELGE